MSAKTVAFLGLSLLACGFAGGARAAGSALKSVQIHGFASQGLVLSKGNDVNGHSIHGGSAQYQEFGLNGSWQPRGDLLLSGQLASIRAGDSTDDYLTLEYGLVDYSPLQGENGRLGLRAGKLKLPIGFYNDSRDAVFTRPSILLPQGIYLDTSGGRAFGYFSLWGGSAYADWYLRDHAIYLEAGGYGPQKMGDTADIAILRADAQGEFRFKQGVLLRLSDDYDGGRLRAAASLASVSIQYRPAAGQAFSPGNVYTQSGDLDFDQAVLSLQYNWPAFSLTGEYVWRDFKLDELIQQPNPFNASSKVELSPTGAYLQGTYRISPKWSGFLRYDEQIRDGNDRAGRAQAARFHKPRHYFFAHDWTAGTRYDLRNNFAVWAEFHYVDGAAWVSPIDNPQAFTTPPSGAADRYWNLLAVMFGYRF